MPDSTSQWARYGSLAAAAAAFIGGALEATNEAQSAIFITVGLILTGVWITLEIHYLLHPSTARKEHPDEHDDTTG